MSEEKLTDLETKVAYLEGTVGELSDQLYHEQKRIEELEVACKYLLKEIKEISTTTDNSESDEPPPPHY